MSKTAWPTEEEVTSRLTGLGVTSIPTGVTLQDEIDGAVEALQKATGRNPFLVQDTAADYKFDPTRNTFMSLQNRWVSITSITVADVVLTEDTDYWLKPYGGPYTSVEFATALISDGTPLSVTVNGKRGYSATVPVEVWNAVMDYAAANVYETAAQAGTVNSGSVTKIKQDTVELTFGSSSSGSSGQSTADSLRAKAMAVFAKYAHIGFGGS